MSDPTIGVLAVQGDVREHLSALDAVGLPARSVRRRAELDAVDGIILPGGESTAMMRLLVVVDLLDPLRAAIAGGLPTYGSCAGMILLAERLLDGAPGQQTVGGLDATVRRNAFGRQVDSFEGDLEVTGLRGGPMHAVFIRAPWVEAVGPDVEVLARVPNGPAAGRIVAVRERNVLATAFHPEVGGDHRIHEHFSDLVRARLATRRAGQRADRR